MDIEQLKLILSVLEKAGDAGSDMFLWWLLADKILPLFLSLIFGVGVYKLALHVVAIFREETLPARLRDAMGVGSPGLITASEVRGMFEWIEEKKKAT